MYSLTPAFLVVDDWMFSPIDLFTLYVLQKFDDYFVQDVSNSRVFNAFWETVKRPLKTQ